MRAGGPLLETLLFFPISISLLNIGDCSRIVFSTMPGRDMNGSVGGLASRSLPEEFSERQWDSSARSRLGIMKLVFSGDASAEWKMHTKDLSLRAVLPKGSTEFIRARRMIVHGVTVVEWVIVVAAVEKVHDREWDAYGYACAEQLGVVERCGVWDTSSRTEALRWAWLESLEKLDVRGFECVQVGSIEGIRAALGVRG